MKVSGFTFIRNAIKFDYPVQEAIRSILPLCNEMIVAVGNSEDETRALVASIDPGKIKIIDTEWDETLRKEGAVLAAETNKALDAIAPDSDWAFYIQGDEVLHESGFPALRMSMEQWANDPKVEGLLFQYRHFWGSYDWTGNSRKWYPHEVRIIRPHQGIRSFRDAQGFRKGAEKLRVKRVDAWIHHYGWVKPPKAQQAKQQTFHQYWHDDNWIRDHVGEEPEYDYSQVGALERFSGTHPEVMKKRIQRQNWEFTPNFQAKPLSRRHKFLDQIERQTGIRIGAYRNYKVI